MDFLYCKRLASVGKNLECE